MGSLTVVIILVIVCGFALLALWIVSRSPTPVRFRLSRLVRLEIEGGGVVTRPDEASTSNAPGAITPAQSQHSTDQCCCQTQLQGHDRQPGGDLSRTSETGPHQFTQSQRHLNPAASSDDLEGDDNGFFSASV